MVPGTNIPQTEIATVQSGFVQIFDHFESEGPMWTQVGDREERRTVVFDRPFQSPPHLLLSLAMADADISSNIRFDLRAEEITGTDFEIVFRTWNDSLWARARVSWMAVGSAIRDEYWVDF